MMMDVQLPLLPPLEAPRWTQVPNVVIDVWMRHLTSAQLRVALALLRWTFGWRRRGAEISTASLCRVTGLSARSVRRAAAGLVEAGVVRIHQQVGGGGQVANRYELVIEGEVGEEE